jgi:hypothetical protein
VNRRIRRDPHYEPPVGPGEHLARRRCNERAGDHHPSLVIQDDAGEYLCPAGRRAQASEDQKPETPS